MDSIRHGTEEQLELYALGRLSDSESAVLEEHLLICGECLDRLEAAEDFGLSIREASGMNPPPLEQTNSNGSAWGWFSWLMRPVFWAPAAVALLAIAAFLFSYNRVPLVPVAALELTALRGEMASAPPTREVDITLTDVPPEGGPFRLEVVDAMGKQLWTGAGTTGKVRHAFSAGTYFVRLFAANGSEVREYGFVVKNPAP